MIEILLTVAVLNTDPAVPAPETTAPPAPAEEKLICRRMDATGAGRTARQKVCMTREQWRAQDNRAGSKVINGGGVVAGEKRS